MRFAKAVVISFLLTLFFGATSRGEKTPPLAGYLGYGHQRLSMASPGSKAAAHHKKIFHIHRPHLHFPHF
jgi:hypothetical protein